ncbi:hypothetical protein L9F63_016970 [Diploptera punctata]|uniref:rRNA biogenesis protein RRP36 n=1 Tax=Diploptera punctata TaxID=6984 RepID=A0AAD7ZZT5_DIPPU|nr:hypothetical protein L9F63_016970 [Diploptera punctata]
MEEDEVPDRNSIREELSKMSFEDLQKLKEQLGCKVYNEGMFGKRKENKVNFKRDNKNRPREMSSKRPVPTSTMIIPTKKSVPRDPRFDSLCGEFNEKVFSKSYSFLDSIRAKEKIQLKKELKKEENEEKRNEIKYLIQRMHKNHQEQQKQKEKVEKKKKEITSHIESLKQGKKPVYLKKSEKKVLDLVEQYEELKKSGKLNKHIEKHRKKNARRDRKKLDTTKAEIE